MQKRSFTGLMALFVLVGAGVVVGDDQAKEVRRYQLGPLVAEDFRGSPPVMNIRQGEDFSGYLETVVRWNTRYQFEQVGKKRMLKLTEIDIYSAIVPYESFNTRPRDRALLDHEQGHFDITEIFALELRVKMTEQIHDRKPFTVNVTSERDGAEKIDRELQRTMEEARDIHTKRQSEYDEITDHGTNAEKQQHQRTEQKTRLKTLQEKMTELGRR